MTYVTDTIADHKGMMIKLSRRAQYRLERAGISVEFDDVMQEASVAFVKAKQGFSPQHGAKFSTYLWTAIGNNLNRFCDQMRDAYRGAVSLDTPASDSEDAPSLLDVLQDVNALDPQEILMRNQTASETLAQFSPDTRRVLTCLITQPDLLMQEYERVRAYYEMSRAMGHAGPRVKFGIDFICEVLGMSNSRRRSIKHEINCFMEQNQ